MNLASALVLGAILVLAALATWYCRRHGAPCEGSCGGKCAGCPMKCHGKK